MEKQSPLKKTLHNLQGRSLFIIFVPLFLLLAMLNAVAGRVGEIRMTDGSVYRGEITARTPLRIVTWAEDELGIDSKEDLAGYGSDGIFYRFFGRERKFSLDNVQSIRLEPRPDLVSRELPAERMEQRWDWKHPAKYGDAREDISSEKIYIGDPFPVRELQAVVTFNSGETLAGALTRVAVYIQPENEFTAKRFILKSKETGEENQTLADLHHVESIVFHESGREFSGTQHVKLANHTPDNPESIWAVTQETLTPVTVTPVPGSNDIFELSGAFGEDVFVTVLKDGVYQVGWQDKADEQLYKQAQNHVEKLRDYYNEKKLLGVRRIEGTHDVLTLVSLRRKVPETSVRELDPVRFGLASDSSMEFFRLAVWRWRYNPESERMILINRGSFFRKQLQTKETPTPPAKTNEKLWLETTRETGKKPAN